MSTTITPRRTSQASKRQFTPLKKPEVKIDPSERICWVEWKSNVANPITYKWPAIYFSSFDEAQIYNENMTSSQKISFSACLYKFWMSQSKELPVVAQLLGVPSDISVLPLNSRPPHFVLVMEDDFFGNFMEWSCNILSEASQMDWEDPSIQETFNKAVSLGFESILPSEESPTKLLESGNAPMTGDDSFQTPLKPTETNQDDGKGNVVFETPAPGSPAPKAKAPAAKVSKISEPDSNATMVSPHSQSQSPEESKLLSSPEGEIPESPVHTSTSATVVSTDTAEESPEQGTTDESDHESTKPRSKQSKSLSLARPDFRTAETLEQATYALCFAGWRKVEGEDTYVSPRVRKEKETGERYNLKQLEAFLKEEYGWTPKVVNPASPAATATETETPNESSKRTPVNLKRKLSSNTSSAIAETPIRKSRRTRIKQPVRESEKKKRIDDNEEESFYRFENLMNKVLKPHLGWQYKGSKLCNWCYMPADSPGEKEGKHLVDYFYQEEEVVDYCRANDFWGKKMHIDSNGIRSIEFRSDFAHKKDLAMARVVTTKTLSHLLRRSSNRVFLSPTTRPCRSSPLISSASLRTFSVTSSRNMPGAPNPYDFLPEAPTFQVTSSDVKEGGVMAAPQLSKAFGVDGGEDVSPQLSWSGFPENTKSFVVTCYDPDAPTASGFWHWTVYDIPASCTSLDTGAGTDGAGKLPEGAKMLKNDAGFPGYVGCAPPPGHGDHRYIFCVSALPEPALPITPDVSPAVCGFNMFGMGVLARGFLTANFGR
eukprot:Nitzschia sp. Nitz4//scaffold133_size116822//12381//14834//NITZ4_003792-RA/size116822-processed-gene-0.49-mRNA-1//-1//CDS//3329535351//5167//frame0